MKPGGLKQIFHSGGFLNPPEGVAKKFKAPKIKNGLRFNFSNVFKLETCENLFKIFLANTVKKILRVL